MWSEYLVSLLIYVATLVGGLQLLLSQWKLLHCTWTSYQRAQISIRLEKNWLDPQLEIRGPCSQKLRWQTLEGWDSS